MSKKTKASTIITVTQMQDMARKAATAGKGAGIKQARGAHGGDKRDQHRQERQDAKLSMRAIGNGQDFDPTAPRRDRKGKSCMMKVVRSK